MSGWTCIAELIRFNAGWTLAGLMKRCGRFTTGARWLIRPVAQTSLLDDDDVRRSTRLDAIVTVVFAKRGCGIST